MTFTEAAAEVLRLVGKPLHYKEITEFAIEKNLLSHVGKSPEVTMGARLAALLKKEGEENPIVRVKPGVFALRAWKGKNPGPAAKGAPATEDEDDDNDVNALEVEAAQRESAPRDDDEDDDDKPILTGEDELRANLAASGADLFDDEDDDDQPILQAPASSPSAAGAAGAAGAASGDPNDPTRRRRRRRRRRGGRDGDPAPASSPRLDVIQPNAIVSIGSDDVVDGTRDPLSPAPRPMVRERHQILGGNAPLGLEVPVGEGDELAGRELADATLMIMSAFDRGQGPVGVRNVAEALVRRGRLSGDFNACMTQVSASLRADNLRRASAGQRPRFRFGAGGRVALTDWLLSSELVRLETDALQAVERYREASRRILLRKLQELPGHVFVELALLTLEKIGMAQLKSVKRAGAPGGEAHFSGIHKTGGDEIRTAIVIRKDGREIGRERVIDLRGAFHHYSGANSGWLVTTGQVLSGARDEHAATTTQPVALYDGFGFCRLMEDHGIGVIRTTLVTTIPDVDLIETLRGA